MKAGAAADKTIATSADAQPCDQCKAVVIEVGDVFEACAHMVVLGAKILREPGPATVNLDRAGDFDAIALIEDGDGNKIKLVERIRRPHRAGIFL